MKITFDSILNRMKQAFYDECGQNPDNLGDIGARFNAVASEIYSLYCNLDYVKRQSFVQTATGEYLDYHAELRGMSRNSASRAYGELTFSISEPIDQDILIPSGTICSVKDKPFIQFATDADVVLDAGQTSVIARATALESGGEYNVGANEVCKMVNAPAMIERVTNNRAFFGGYSTESDASLRKRILDSFDTVMFGVSKKHLEENIIAIPYIRDCKILGPYMEDDLRVMVILRTIKELDGEMLAEVYDKMLVCDFVGAEYNVIIATEKPITLEIYCDDESVYDEISCLCDEYVDALRIGEALNLNDLNMRLFKELDCNRLIVRCEDCEGSYVNCGGNEYINLAGLVINRG